MSHKIPYAVLGLTRCSDLCRPHIACSRLPDSRETAREKRVGAGVEAFRPRFASPIGKQQKQEATGSCHFVRRNLADFLYVRSISAGLFYVTISW